MKSTFKVLFYLKKDKISKDGKVPVMGRITVTDRLIMFGDLSFDVFKHLVNFARKRISLRFQIIGFLIP